MTGPTAARTASTVGTATGADEEVVTTLRLLAADMVQAAGSGHPGMPLGAAPTAWALWSRHLRFDPDDPAWPDRDRFVLSAGHGSALLYALLHVTGHDLPLAELERFRQLGSATPGHPEHGHTPGVETTTGPLGQGLAAAVGMALAERLLNARFGDDLVWVGEDGPTHQPVEQLESLRLIPGLAVLRPADDAETVDAWRTALARTAGARADGPTALVLSRQALPPLGPVAPGTLAGTGARVVGRPEPAPQVTVLATGSEVALAIEAADALAARGIRTRVLSVPWRERFTALPAADRRRLTGDPALTVAVEAGATIGWAGLTGSPARVLGIDRFGLSGPGAQVARALGLTADHLVDLVLRELTEEDGDA